MHFHVVRITDIECTPMWSLSFFGVHSHMIPLAFWSALPYAPNHFRKCTSNCPPSLYRNNLSKHLNGSQPPKMDFCLPPFTVRLYPNLGFPSLLFKLFTNLLNLNPIGYMKSENLSSKLLILYKIVPTIHFLSTLTVFFTVLFYMNAFLFPEWECLCLPLNMIMV